MKIPSLGLLALSITASSGIFGSPEASDRSLIYLPELAPEQLDAMPLNLARSSVGSKATLIQGIAQDQDQQAKESLLGEDETVPLKLEPGRTLLRLDLPNRRLVDRVYFNSFGAEGRLWVSVSDRDLPADSNKWTPVVSGKSFAALQVCDETFAPYAARYVLFRFEVTQAGEISSLGLFGEDRLSQAANQFTDAPAPTREETVNASSTVRADFASLYTGGYVSHISSGDPAGAQAMLDDDLTTDFTFAAEDRDPIVVVDLRKTYEVQRVSLLAQAAPGRLEIYTLSVLPDSLVDEQAPAGPNGMREVTLPAAFFRENQPNYIAEFEVAQDRMRIDFAPRPTRFLILHWRPAPGEGSPKVARFFAGGAGGGGFTVSEISVIGQVPEDWWRIALPERAEFFNATPPAVPPPPPPSTPPPVISP